MICSVVTYIKNALPLPYITLCVVRTQNFELKRTKIIIELDAFEQKQLSITPTTKIIIIYDERLNVRMPHHALPKMKQIVEVY